MDTLSTQPLGNDVLREEYSQPGETSADEVRRRIARALAQAEPQDRRDEWEVRFLEAQRAGFIPAGRVASNTGTTAGAMLVSCFVQPVGDSISQPEDGHPSIYTALAEAAETLRRGGGIGYDFSRVRPRGARVASTDAHAAGPVAFLRVFDAACDALGLFPTRHGAQMAVLRCDHPDIEVFIDAKARGALPRFKLSVGVTDAFMHAVESGAQVDLAHRAAPAETGTAVRRDDGLWIYRRVNAGELWQRITRAAYDHGEPGVLFLDRINVDNNLAYCETIACASVCGEQPLPPYGACCLGSIDLTQFVVAPFSAAARFDFDAFAAVVPVAVRMLDDVLEVTSWPVPQQRGEALSKRRVGLGFTGLADTLVMLGLHYDSDPARETAARIAHTLRDAAYAASIDLARERGPFPRFDADGLLRKGSFASRLPAELQSGIREHGLRNSHLLCIAPADSISLAFADNVSAGIQPVYAWSYVRHRRLRSGEVRAYEIEDYAWRVWCRMRGPAPIEGDALPPAFVTAPEVRPPAQVEMVAAVAQFVDASIAKTLNIPEHCGYEDFAPAYLHAWRRGLKGITGVGPNPMPDGSLHAGWAAHPGRG